MHTCVLFVQTAFLQKRHHKTWLSLPLLLIASLGILALAGCGGSSTTPPPTHTVQVAVSPTTASVFVSQTATFTATVTGASNTSVTWSIQEGSSGGSVSSAGMYTAPAAAGTFHVIATSQADASKSASATVTVPGPPPAPTFTSTAPTSASEGQPYSYMIAASDPAGGTVSYQLTSGPTNASLTGNVLTWAPSHPQSRTSNGFTITATTSEQASATQMFAVTPNGNIDGVVNVIEYTSNGKAVTPVQVDGVVAYVPTVSGSYTQIAGTGGLGTFSVSGVPSGYFLLQVGLNSAYSQLE